MRYDFVMQSAQTPAVEAPTNDATLRALTTTVGDIFPAIYGTRSSFVVNVASTIEKASVTATATDPRATITLNGTAIPSGEPTAELPLAPGLNDFRLEVTAADGVTRHRSRLKIIRAQPLLNWVKLLDEAPFKIRDSEGELVFNNRMWILGGYTPELVSDIWSSADGQAWRREGDVPDPQGVNIPVRFAHAGRMWIAGQSGNFYSSPDGANWSLVTDHAPWKGRYAAGSAVFNGRMWVAGGHAGGDIFNDVWSSADGTDWRLETAGAPWSPRQLFGNLVVHQNKLWVIGGGVTVYQPVRAYNDVWCSADGKAWTRVTDDAPWPVRIWSECAVYRDRLWLLGGFRGQPTDKNFGDVWYSRDGADWRQLHTENAWEPRHESSPMVLNDKLYLVAGNAWPLKNDVWVLDIPGLAFTTQPVVEEFVRARYRYDARADFNRAPGAVRYRLIHAPAWLSIHEATGRVTGEPDAVGDFPVVIEAFDDAGEAARQSYTLHVITAER
jgi:hypothetical protein